MDQVDSAPVITEELPPLLNNKELGALGFACVTLSARKSTETKSCNSYGKKKKNGNSESKQQKNVFK